MQFMQQYSVYIFTALLIAWFIWQRLLGPKLSGVKSISVADYMQLRNRPHTLLDVRQPGEWQAMHAANAVHIPLGEVRERMREIPSEKPVVVICASGARSSMAATALARAGFSEVYNFSGGMGAWSGSGLPTRSN